MIAPAPGLRSFRFSGDVPPPAIRRMLRRARWAVIIIVLLGLLLCVAAILTVWLARKPGYSAGITGWIAPGIRLPSWSKQLARAAQCGLATGGLLMLFGAGIWVAAYTRCKRRLAARARHEQLELCFSCGYELKGLPESHRCPECGARYSKAELIAKWHEWLDHLDPSEYRTS